MAQGQQLIPSTENIKELMQKIRLSRISYSLVVALVVALALTLLEALVLLLLNPFHLLSTTSNRFGALLALSIHAPLVLLVFLVELGSAFLVALLGARSLATMTYLRDTARTQKHYNDLYTPLTTITNLRKTTDIEQQSDLSSPALAQEQRVALVELVEQRDTHQFILGVPGAGKTMTLRVYQYLAACRPWMLVIKRERIPVFVPMKNYSLFLKQRTTPVSTDENITSSDALASPATLLAFLQESDLPGMRHLRPYLPQLAEEGRLLLLCDGLNEVDSNYLARMSQELVQLMSDTHNRLVMTCREVDYRVQEELVTLVEEGRAAKATIYPLQSDEVPLFVERYIEQQDKHWRHTAGQIMQVIDRSRLRYHCTNPMMLFTLMSIIDKIGVERGKQIDTRGRLLRESVRQVLEYEQQQPKWNKAAPPEREVIRFLSEVACAARWANDRNAIQLRVSTQSLVTGEGTHEAATVEELADELRFWLDEHPARGPFVLAKDADAASTSYDDPSLLLQFALSAALIEVSSGGVLSFRHELIAEYFVAEYFFAAERKQATLSLPVQEALLEHVGRWSEPVAIWAGLMEDPLALAERFAMLDSSNPAYVLQALALSLVCVGVSWTPPQAEMRRNVVLPQHVAEALSIAVRDKAAREELARSFTCCAEEGGQEVYRSLLPLIMIDGVDELLPLLDQAIVPDLLFAHLQDTVDDVAYEVQVKRLTQVLGRFGGVVVGRAAQLSLPAPERRVRLRAAAVNILGGTHDQLAVEPLIARLNDTDAFIINRATNALYRLGPEIILTQLLRELENRQQGAQVHQAALTLLGRFLEEPEGKRYLSSVQYLRILESVIPVLASNYQSEPDVQRLARELLVRQGRQVNTSTAPSKRGERVIEALMLYLPSQNEVVARNVILVLQELGSAATMRLLDQLSVPSEIMYIRVIDVLRVIRDLRALPRLLLLMDNPSSAVQQQVANALRAYAPESIPGLIELVLSNSDDLVAERAAQILSAIGDAVVGPVTRTFDRVVSGRTHLLVQVLELVHDPQAIPALIDLLQASPREPLLSIAIVHTLSRFSDQRVVQSLMTMLVDANPQVYEEAIDALSQLGEVALPDLLAALDVSQDTSTVQRVRRAILGMMPFPAAQLLQTLVSCSNAQAQHIRLIFKTQGADAAQELVQHLLHEDERVRRYIYQTLVEMAGAVVVPALLEALHQPGQLRKVASALLLKYPDAAISPLVDLLGERERGDVAATILAQFGPKVLAALVSGLDDQRTMAREHAQSIIDTLVRQSQDRQAVLHDIMHLFYPPPPPRAREVLLGVLTSELASMSIPTLLDGLEDAHLFEDAAEAFVRLVRKPSSQRAALTSLLEALHVEEQRRGAEMALIKIGAPAVPAVGELISSQDPLLAKAAKHILREMGVPALPFIWTAYSDTGNRARREVAREIFHSMPTDVIKDELVTLLVSDQASNIAMAVSLLLERIGTEAGRHYADREMIPELFEYIQTHTVEEINLRIIALLLLLGENAINDYLIQTLDEYPQHRKQLTYVLLLLGAETQEALLDVFNDPATPIELRAELAAVLGMVTAPEIIAEYAQTLSEYALPATRGGASSSEQQAIALRSLGGLLASGNWHSRKLQDLRDASKEGSGARELFNVLLGWRYEPQLAMLQRDLAAERDAHKKEIVALGARIVADQKRIQGLEDNLEKVREEHGERGDELRQLAREKDALRNNADNAAKERDNLVYQLQQALKENQGLRDHNTQLSRQLKNLTTPGR